MTIFRKHVGLADLQRGCCYLCGERMPKKKRTIDRDRWRTKEHILPISRGGRLKHGNVALAHMKCNFMKGNRLPYPCEVLLGQALALRLDKMVPGKSKIPVRQPDRIILCKGMAPTRV